ncbi:transposable element Tcb2 transposase [Trichonephila clavipes]|nr:transposable element Tcb2 transposase [Trichonephila clavipes]
MTKSQDRIFVRQPRTAPTVTLSTIQRTTDSYIPPWYLSPSHGPWLRRDWHRIVFSNESSFSFEADDHLLRVLRGWSLRSQSAFVLKRHTSLTPGVTVLGVILYDRRSSVIILHTLLTTQWFVDTLLWSSVLPFMTRQLVSGLYQDNARFSVLLT